MFHGIGSISRFKRYRKKSRVNLEFQAEKLTVIFHDFLFVRNTRYDVVKECWIYFIILCVTFFDAIFGTIRATWQLILMASEHLSKSYFLPGLHLSSTCLLFNESKIKRNDSVAMHCKIKIASTQANNNGFPECEKKFSSVHLLFVVDIPFSFFYHNISKKGTNIWPCRRRNEWN